jgi:hypothetical protein
MKYHLLAAALIFLIASCGVENIEHPSSKSKANNVDSKTDDAKPKDTSPKDSAGKSPEDINLEEFSRESFKSTLYPILKENCGGCHGAVQAPFFASDKSADAHDTLIDNKKVDLTNIEASRVVKKLRESQHNCWSGDCGADSDVIANAIGDWYQLILDQGLNDADTAANQTAELAFTDGTLSKGPADLGTMVFNAIDYSTLAAPFASVTGDDDQGVSTYIVAPQNNGQIVTANGAGGETTYEFDVANAGTYAIWGRIMAPTGNSNSFHVKMDDGPFLAWGTAISMDEWVWDRANQDNGQTELSFNLPAGKHTVTIKHREEQTRFNRIVLTDKLESFDGPEAVGELIMLSFDLKDLTGKNALLTMNALVFDKATNAILIKNIAIETDEELYVKDLMPMINGSFNPQHATFRLVDKTIPAPGASLSEASLIIIGDDGWDLDKLSFSFGEIK